MKEHINDAGGKHWYGNHFVELQKETLDALQGFFKNFGACIISGCEITPNAGTPTNRDIAAGIVGINHADGYKIVRFAGATNVAASGYMGYMSVLKTNVSGVYNSGAGTIAYDYTAVFTTGSAPSSSSLYLPISEFASDRQDFNKALSSFQFTEWRTFSVSVPNASGTLKVRVDKIARRMHIMGTLLIKNMAAWFTDYEEITILPQATLAADAVIGSWALYPSVSTIVPTAFVSSTVPSLTLEDVNNLTIIMSGTAAYDGDLKVTALKAAGNQQYIIAVKIDAELTA
ncbi:MAG: hypothetical protein ACK4EY_16130 [Flavipsychrobacter sp.]